MHQEGCGWLERRHDPPCRGNVKVSMQLAQSAGWYRGEVGGAVSVQGSCKETESSLRRALQGTPLMKVRAELEKHTGRVWAQADNRSFYCA